MQHKHFSQNVCFKASAQKKKGMKSRRLQRCYNLQYKGVRIILTACSQENDVQMPFSLLMIFDMLFEAKNIPSQTNNSFTMCVLKNLLLMSDWTETFFFFRCRNSNAIDPKALKKLRV